MAIDLTSVLDCSPEYLGPSVANVCSASSVVLFMALVNAFLTVTEDISEICHRTIPVDQPDNTHDFIVIGSGAGGSVVAGRLSEIPEWTVLLLEAGPDEPPATAVPSFNALFYGSYIDWNYKTTNEANACLSTNGSCIWPRGKVMGGTTILHGMMYTRGNPTDYNIWAAQGNTGWSWEEVEPYFMRSENNTEINRVGRKHHGVGGPQTVQRYPAQPSFVQDILAAGAEGGHRVSEDLCADFSGFSIAQMTSKDGIRQSTAAAFVRAFRNRKNLQVSMNSTATKIIIRNKRAVGVEYYKNGRLLKAMASKEVIIAGGAVNSPQLLLLSGIGPEEELKQVGVTVVKDLSGVGKNLNNHVSYTLQFTVNDTDTHDLDWATLTEYLAFRKGPMASTGITQVTAIIPTSKTTSNYPDIQLFFRGYNADCAPGKIGALRSSGRRRIAISPAYLHAKSRGTVRLTSTDPLEHPMIWGNYLNVSSDIEGLVEGIQIAIALTNTTAFRAHDMQLSSLPLKVCSEFEFSTNEYWACAIRYDTSPENHQAGTCKMGPQTDPFAVVDSELRVYGIEGLRVADASIMPNMISGNPAGPIMMIGERAADFIKNHWKARKQVPRSSVKDDANLNPASQFNLLKPASHLQGPAHRLPSPPPRRPKPLVF